MLAAQLHEAVNALRSTETPVITLIDGHSTCQANTVPGIVGELRSGIVTAARFLLLETVRTLTADDWVLMQLYTLARNVVVDIREVLSSKYQTHDYEM